MVSEEDPPTKKVKSRKKDEEISEMVSEEDPPTKKVKSRKKG